MSSKGKNISKGKKATKGKTTVKTKSKGKGKISKAQKTEALATMMDLMPRSTQTDLSTFFSKLAKERKPVKKKKATRKEVIQSYQELQEKITAYEIDKKIQYDFRWSFGAGQDAAYKSWVRGLSNSEDYPKYRSMWRDRWDKTAKKDEKGQIITTLASAGNGQNKHIGKINAYNDQIKKSKELKKKFKKRWNESLSQEALKKDIVVESSEEIAGEVKLGIFGYQMQNEKKEWIEETHIFNHKLLDRPIYKNPISVELTKSDDWGNINLRYNSELDQAQFNHDWMSMSEFRTLTHVFRENNVSYNQDLRKATMKYDENKVAKVVKALRDKHLPVEISPSVPKPKPILLEKIQGDDRFEILLDVDRTTFKVKVTGREAMEFLDQLDYDTKEEMFADDKIAYLKEHEDAIKPIADYKKTLKLKGEKLENKVDKWIVDELSGLLPSDNTWHFVNREEQTIPLGFVYHHVLATEPITGKPKYDYNMKITDNRRLYLEVADPISPLLIDPKTKTPFELRDYQASAVESAIDKRSGIVEAATGSGKTEIGAFIIAGYGLDAVWFAHREELIKQAEKRMERRLGVDVGVYSGTKKEIVDTPRADINVMTTQSASDVMRVPRSEHLKEVDKLKRELSRLNKQIDKEENEQKRRLLVIKRDSGVGVQSKLTKAELELQLYDFVSNATVQIFDESHHLTSLQFGDIARSTPQARYRYGLSATPYGNSTTDQRRIEALMGKSVAQITATKLINEGYLAKPNIILVDIPHMAEPLYPVTIYHKRDIPEKGIKKGDKKKVAFDDNALTFHELKTVAITTNDKFNNYVADFTIDCRKAGLNTMVLVQEVKHGQLVKSKLEDRGLKVDFLNATTEDSEKKRIILDRFREGETDTIVATFGVAGEGVDIPNLDVVIKADGYKALVPTLQSIGRAMRIPKDSDKKECLIIDFDRKEKHYGYHPEKDSHIEERLKHYDLEKAFEVKRRVPISEVDDEINRIATINKAKARGEQEEAEELMDIPKRFRTREQKAEIREIMRGSERLERGLKVETFESGVSDDAKRIYRRLPKFKDRRMSVFEIQAVINRQRVKGIESDQIDWKSLDRGITVEEAISSANL